MLDDRLQRRPARLVPDAERVRHRVRHQRAVLYGGQRHQPHPVREAPYRPSATRPASRVLPTPPGPVSVSSLVAANSRLACVSSWRRPTKLVPVTGNPTVRRDPAAPKIGHALFEFVELMVPLRLPQR